MRLAPAGPRTAAARPSRSTAVPAAADRRCSHPRSSGRGLPFAYVRCRPNWSHDAVSRSAVRSRPGWMRSPSSTPPGPALAPPAAVVRAAAPAEPPNSPKPPRASAAEDDSLASSGERKKPTLVDVGAPSTVARRLHPRSRFRAHRGSAIQRPRRGPSSSAPEPLRGRSPEPLRGRWLRRRSIQPVPEPPTQPCADAAPAQFPSVSNISPPPLVSARPSVMSTPSSTPRLYLSLSLCQRDRVAALLLGALALALLRCRLAAPPPSVKLSHALLVVRVDPLLIREREVLRKVAQDAIRGESLAQELAARRDRAVRCLPEHAARRREASLLETLALDGRAQ
mmetsp:Transcript_30970/g.100900  ORF Transcript_30970/g.100900 Transcript_30970/m.100900 type:complete len:339 (-) Transcript_30970:11-1027(-)